MRASHPLSVLVVEDNPDTAAILADLLRLCGHRVVVACTAGEALAAADATPPDVALLDMRLPDLDGWQVARQLRAQADGRQKRPFLIAVTGCGTTDDRWRSVDAGVDLHLLKPVDPGLLTGLLARFSESITPPAGDGASEAS